MTRIKKTNTVTSIAFAVLFAAMLVYLGASFIGSRDKLATVPAIRATISDSATIHGLAVREELLVVSDRAYVSLSVDDGDGVARGQVLGSAMDSDAALERDSRRRELKNEISHIESLLSRLGSAGDAVSRSSSISAALCELSSSVSSGDVGAIDAICASVGSLVFKESGADYSESDLNAMRAELNSIETSSYADSELLNAGESGVFSTIVDGYEGISPSMLKDLTPDGVQDLIAAREAPAENVAGKIVTASRWYFAAVMDSGAAEELTEGSYVTVTFGRRYGGAVKMRVEDISTATDGKRAVVFSTVNGLEDALPMREADAEIVSREYSGLRVPARALHVDEEGKAFVYVRTSNQIEIKYVTTVFQSDDYFIVELESSAYSLREGNEVIVSGDDLHDGKILG